jgi:hypothetical protein
MTYATIEELLSAYAGRNLLSKPWKMFLLSAEDSLELISEGLANGFLLYGFEGFHIFENQSIQPDQLLSVESFDFYGRPEEDFTTSYLSVLESCRSNPMIGFEVMFEPRTK